MAQHYYYTDQLLSSSNDHHLPVPEQMELGITSIDEVCVVENLYIYLLLTSFICLYLYIDVKVSVLYKIINLICVKIGKDSSAKII